jgi:hypothetical protein
MAIEEKSPADLVQLAMAGARIVLDGRRYAARDLSTIAKALRQEGLLTIVNCEGKATRELVSVVSAAPGKVMLA